MFLRHVSYHFSNLLRTKYHLGSLFFLYLISSQIFVLQCKLHYLKELFWILRLDWDWIKIKVSFLHRNSIVHVLFFHLYKNYPKNDHHSSIYTFLNHASARFGTIHQKTTIFYEIVCLFHEKNFLSILLHTWNQC